MRLSIAALVLVCSGVAQAGDTRYVRAVLLPDCKSGYLDACEELTHIAADELAVHTDRGQRWWWSKRAMVACDAGLIEACVLLRGVGRRWAASDDPVERDTGVDLLGRMCVAHPAEACDAAIRAAQELAGRADDDAQRAGGRLLNRACLGGASEACELVVEAGGDVPHGRSSRLLGNIMSYTGMGLNIASGITWAATFSQDRCGTRRNRADVAPLFAGCSLGMIGYAVGFATSIAGTKIRLNGVAQGDAVSTEVSGHSWLWYAGIGVGALGAIVPAGIELLGKDWREAIAAAPLVAGVGAEVLFLLARLLGPEIEEPPGGFTMHPTVAHVPLGPDRHETATTFGAVVTY